MNKVFISGHVGADPEVKYLQSGSTVANFNIAVNEQWKDKTTGEMKKKTSWFRVTSYGKSAELARDHIHKGDKIGVEGKLDQRTWEDRDTGKNRSSVEIRVDRFEFYQSRLKASNSDQPKQATAEDTGDMTGEGEDIPF